MKRIGFEWWLHLSVFGWEVPRAFGILRSGGDLFIYLFLLLFFVVVVAFNI